MRRQPLVSPPDGPTRGEHSKAQAHVERARTGYRRRSGRAMRRLVLQLDPPDLDHELNGVPRRPRGSAKTSWSCPGSRTISTIRTTFTTRSDQISRELGDVVVRGHTN